MEVTVLPRLPFTRALHEWLGQRFTAGTEVYPIGWGAVPRKDTGEQYVAPYAILYSLWSEVAGPPLGRLAAADATWVYQLTMAGKRGDQVEWMRDRLTDALLARTATGWKHPIVVPGLTIMSREISDDAGGEVSELQLDVRFNFKVTPEGGRGLW